MPRRRDEDPEYQEFLTWKNNRAADDDEDGDDLEDDDEDQDDDEDDGSGIAVLTGRRADAFIERMFGAGDSGKPARRKNKTKPEPEEDQPDEEDEPDEDPEPSNRGHRFFRDRSRG